MEIAVPAAAKPKWRRDNSGLARWVALSSGPDFQNAAIRPAKARREAKAKRSIGGTRWARKMCPFRK